jgi:hypothetical protein
MSNDPLEAPTVRLTFEDGHVENVNMSFPREEETTFWASLGYGVNGWCHIDRSLFDCFHLLLGADENKSAIIFYSFKTSSQRKQVLQELIAVSGIEASLEAEWKAITTEMTRLTPLRNLLAHQPALTETTIANTATPENPHGYTVNHRMKVMVEPKEALRGKRKSETLAIADLERNVSEVTELQRKLLNFVKTLQAKHGPGERSLPPANGETSAP